MCHFFHNFAHMIFYFSGTGNTRWAARQLSEATHEPLVFIPDHMQGPTAYELAEGERIGFCFPVHGWRPPRLVRQFVSQLRLQAKGHYVYALCTAGDNIGETIEILEADLLRTGMHLDAAYSLIMPESYVGLPFMDVDTAKKENDKKQTADLRLKAFLPTVLNREKGVRNLDKGHWPRINSRLIGGFFDRWLISDKPFHVDTARCIGCARCAEVCPVGDIKCAKGSAPEWQHNGHCLTCFACYHHCPRHAIEYGKRTLHKGQYYFEHTANDNT